MDRAYLELESLTVGYGGEPVVSDITFKLQKGQILSLIGPNGAGKSTILKTLTRRIPPISGKITLDGADLLAMGGRTLAKKMASVLTDRVAPELETCFDIVSAGRYPYTGGFGLLTARDRAAVDEALRMVNAASIADRDFNSVSDGQRQRVLLARAIAQEPEIILLDEPTSFLDIKHKLELLEILRDMARQRGVTILMSLHELDLASKVSDLIACVSSGRVPACGRPREIMTDGGVRTLYGLERGSYNASLGSVELPRPAGRARVFVLGGGGRGIGLYRELQKAGIPFFAGILHENDIDLAVARPLSERVVTCPAFRGASPERIAEARALIDRAEAVLDCGCPDGGGGANAALLRYARESGKSVVTDLNLLTEVLK